MKKKKNIQIKLAREHAGKTQLQVASEVGIGLRSYVSYENGEKPSPSVHTAIRIANALYVHDLRKLWDNQSEPPLIRHIKPISAQLDGLPSA